MGLKSQGAKAHTIEDNMVVAIVALMLMVETERMPKLMGHVGVFVQKPIGVAVAKLHTRLRIGSHGGDSLWLASDFDDQSVVVGSFDDVDICFVNPVVSPELPALFYNIA